MHRVHYRLRIFVSTVAKFCEADIPGQNRIPSTCAFLMLLATLYEIRYKLHDNAVLTAKYEFRCNLTILIISSTENLESGDPILAPSLSSKQNRFFPRGASLTFCQFVPNPRRRKNREMNYENCALPVRQRDPFSGISPSFIHSSHTGKLEQTLFPSAKLFQSGFPLA